MAIAVGTFVSPSIGSTLANPVGQAVRGPAFGRAETASPGPHTVLWQDGNHATGIAETSLDVIDSTDSATRDMFVGRRVQVNTPAGQTNWGTCVCVAAYKRNGENVLLLQNAGGEYFIEVLSSACVAIQ